MIKWDRDFSSTSWQMRTSELFTSPDYRNSVIKGEINAHVELDILVSTIRHAWGGPDLASVYCPDNWILG